MPSSGRCARADSARRTSDRADGEFIQEERGTTIPKSSYLPWNTPRNRSIRYAVSRRERRPAIGSLRPGRSGTHLFTHQVMPMRIGAQLASRDEGASGHAAPKRAEHRGLEPGADTFEGGVRAHFRGSTPWVPPSGPRAPSRPWSVTTSRREPRCSRPTRRRGPSGPVGRRPPDSATRPSPRPACR